MGYDSAVFRKVGSPDPAPEWTIDDFEETCAAIAAAKGAGRLPNLVPVLPPLVATVKRIMAISPLKLGRYGSFSFIKPTLWEAFVVGFGGTVASGRRYDLTNAGAVAGLERMVDIAVRYGPPPDQPVLSAGALAFQPAAAGVLTATFTPVSLASNWRWARFPRLRARPIVPADVGGVTVQKVGQFNPFGPPLGTAPEALRAAAQYAMWWYARTRATPLPGIWSRPRNAPGTLPASAVVARGPSRASTLPASPPRRRVR